MSWRSAAVRVTRSGSGKVDRRERVPVDVVRVISALLDADCGHEFGEDLFEQPCLLEHRDTGARMRGDEHAADLVADPLDREDRRSRRLRAHRLDRPGREREAEPGDESRRPVHAQRILGEGLDGIEWRPQHPGKQVGRPPGR